MHRHPLSALRVSLVVGVLFALAQLVTTAALPPGALLSSFTDDYYYYHVVARNFVNGAGLSFDGIEATNGFHPLWFAVVATLRAVMDDTATLLAVKTLCALLPLAGAWGIFRLALVRLAPRFDGTPPVAPALALAAIYYALAFYLAKQGMEVALTLAVLPFFVLALERGIGGARDLFHFSLLASLVILSRLDSALMVLPLWLFGLAQHVFSAAGGVGPRLRALFAPQLILAGMAGFAPILLYTLMNLQLFGGLLPQSAAAKALVTSPGPYPDLFNALAWKWTWLLLTLWALGTLVFVLSRDNWRVSRLPGWIILGWPALFYAWLAFRSPWPLWQWYLYPLVFASVVGLCARPFGGRLYARLLPLLAIGVVGIVAVKHVSESRDTEANSLVGAGGALTGFQRTHPGRYAMGDRAGVVGYLLGSPVLQLEGLVGGKDVIRAVREERNLLGFLRDKGVRYYVATDLVRDANGCYLAAEPKQGSAARRMRATLCAAPVFAYRTTTPEGQRIENLVFDLARTATPRVQEQRP